MQIVTHTEEPTAGAHDLVVVGVFAGETATTPAVGQFNKALGGALTTAAEEQDFQGKPKQQLVLNTLGQHASRRIALMGLGARPEHTAETFLRLGGAAARLGNAVGAKNVLLALPKLDANGMDVAQLVARGAALGTYRYDAYKSDKGRTLSVKKLALHGGAASDKEVSKDTLKRAQWVSESVALARDWVNQPAMALYPESFADEAKRLAEAAGLRCQVLGPQQLEKLDMNLLLGVGRGSVHAPRLVHLTYTPDGGGKAKDKGKDKARDKSATPGGVALVGKGITFDSGGLCLKTAAGMLDMKIDMAGAAVVLATMLALAKLKPDVTVHGVMALAENMPSGNAIRPGDVITSAAGKTVEINNTDAEGRLVLADALHYIAGFKPTQIIDLATLTGACIVALGPLTVGLFSNNDALADGLLAASKRVGEDVWRLPLTPSLKDQLKSDVADMRNSGDGKGGAIIAALFLKEFVGTTAWAHMDIAGPAVSSEDAGAFSKGATGIGVATLIDYLLAAP